MNKISRVEIYAFNRSFSYEPALKDVLNISKNMDCSIAEYISSSLVELVFKRYRLFIIHFVIDYRKEFAFRIDYQENEDIVYWRKQIKEYIRVVERNVGGSDDNKRSNK